MAAPSLGERLCALLDTAGHADADEAAADAPTTFVCSSPLTCTNPGLEVSAAGGRIALPLQEDQAAALKAVCSLAPFGQGEATVTDTAVRHTWQLDPSAFQLTNPRKRHGRHALGQGACRLAADQLVSFCVCAHACRPAAEVLGVRMPWQGGRTRLCQRPCAAPRQAWAYTMTQVGPPWRRGRSN